MLITALTQFTALDFPGKLACIIFTGGCNLRCGYCHNAEFVLPGELQKFKKFIPFDVVKNFLKAREGMLEGVVICGGEPTNQYDLFERVKEIKELGLAVKLDTNGTNPKSLAKLLEAGLLDYVAMDLKDALPYRKELVGVEVGGEKIKESISLIINSGVDYEFRSTILPEFHSLEVLEEMAELLNGAKKWVLQGFRAQKTLDLRFGEMGEFSQMDMQILANRLSKLAKNISVRT